MLRHRFLPLAAIAAATLALSACGGTSTSTDPYGSVSGPGAAAPAPVDPNAGASAPAGGPLLAAKEAAGLGTIVTDADGFTLYRFDKDTAKPTPSTTCVDACATKWPPVTVDPKGKLALEGVDQAAVGLLRRPDGTSQLTLGGWPVYRFAGDQEPGATGGQGVSGTWFAVKPDGKKAAGTGSGATAKSGASGSGTGTSGAAGAAGAAGGSAGGAAGTDADGARSGSAGDPGSSAGSGY